MEIEPVRVREAVVQPDPERVKACVVGMAVVEIVLVGERL